jgi:hypothetical protein
VKEARRSLESAWMLRKGMAPTVTSWALPGWTGLLEDGGRPPSLARLLVLRERMVSREATASPSSLGRGVVGNMM